MDQDGSALKKSPADGYIAIGILVLTLMAVAVGGYLFLRNNNIFGDNGNKVQLFSPPPERELYMKGKEKLDVRVPSEYEELKKLLMRRAIHTIPILLSLQNEGNSIERLYKRGMLTDNMHFHVKELKAFVDKEFQDIQFEADDLVEGWGQQIWPQAMQFHQMILKQAEEKSEEQRAAEEEKKRLKKEKEKAKKAVTKEDALAKEPVVAEDPEVVKQREAERMAQLLLEEEERERATKRSSLKGNAKK